MITTQDQRELRMTLSHFPQPARRGIVELMRDGLSVVDAALIIQTVCVSTKAWPRNPVQAVTYVH